MSGYERSLRGDGLRAKGRELSAPCPIHQTASSSGFSRVTVVVAAYNEAERIAAVLRDLMCYGCRLVVVDDGSTDRTADIAASAGAIVVRHIINRGQGAALLTGIEFALWLGAEVVVTMDADGQHCASDLPAVVGPIVAGQCDVVLGSRFLDHRTAIPHARRWLLKLALQFTRFTTGLDLSDTHNGYRAFARRAAQALRLTEDRMAHATEILHQVHANGWSYREVPVRVLYSDETLCKGQANWEALRIVGQLLVSRLFRPLRA